MRFMTTAKRKLNPRAARCLEQTRRIAGQEATPRVLTTSMVDPRSAFLAGLAQVTLMGKKSTGACLSTNWSEVSCCNQC